MVALYNLDQVFNRHPLYADNACVLHWVLFSNAFYASLCRSGSMLVWHDTWVCTCPDMWPVLPTEISLPPSLGLQDATIEWQGSLSSTRKKAAQFHSPCAGQMELAVQWSFQASNRLNANPLLSKGSTSSREDH